MIHPPGFMEQYQRYKVLQLLPETKPGPGWFPFWCSCNIVTVIIFQVPGWDKFCKKKGKIPLISIFYKYLSDFSSQMKVKNVPAYPLHFWVFSAFRDQYAASLSCSDIFLVSSLHYSVCLLSDDSEQKTIKEVNLFVSQPPKGAVIHPNRKFKTLWMDVTEL